MLDLVPALLARVANLLEEALVEEALEVSRSVLHLILKTPHSKAPNNSTHTAIRSSERKSSREREREADCSWGISELNWAVHFSFAFEQTFGATDKNINESSSLRSIDSSKIKGTRIREEEQREREK